MGTRNKKVDAYIASTPDWAQPILSSLRTMIHAASPDIDEELKWSRPAFMYRGKILCGIVAFKAHCALYFWNGSQVVENRADGSRGPTSQFGRMASVKDLPSKKDVALYTKKAMKLIADGVKPARAAKKRKPLAMPDYFMTAIKKNKKALATYQGFSPSHQRDYIEWVTEAKGEDTRARRITQAVEWMAEGKPRHWKYMR